MVSENKRHARIRKKAQWKSPRGGRWRVWESRLAKQRPIQGNAGEEGTLVVALTGEVNAEVVLGRDGVGYLVSEDLPPLSSQSTYQLWAIVDDRVISAGVLGSAPSVAPFNVDGAAAVDGFALTIEVRGGVVSSEHAPVSIGLVEA